MFTRQDFKNFLDKILEIELEMEKETRELRSEINHPEADKILDNIITDEIRHANIVREMYQLVDQHPL